MSAPRSWQADAVRTTGQVLVFDAGDLAAESAFWADLLGGTVATRAGCHSVVVGGAVAVGVQRARGHQPPSRSCRGPSPLGEVAATHVADS